MARYVSRKYFAALLWIPFVGVLLIPADSICDGIVSRSNFLFTFPFFIYGFYFHRYRLAKGASIKKKELCLSMLILGLSVVCDSYLKNRTFNYAIAFSVINILVFLFDKMLSKMKLVKFLGNYCGKETQAIYVIHYFFLGLTPFQIIDGYDGSLSAIVQYTFIAVASAALIMLMSLLTSYFLGKFKLTRQLLLGKE